MRSLLRDMNDIDDNNKTVGMRCVSNVLAVGFKCPIFSLDRLNSSGDGSFISHVIGISALRMDHLDFGLQRSAQLFNLTRLPEFTSHDNAECRKHDNKKGPVDLFQLFNTLINRRHIVHNVK